MVLLTQEKLVERLPDAEKEVRAAGIARAEQNSKSQSNCGVSGQRLGDYLPARREPNQLCLTTTQLYIILWLNRKA